MYQELLLVSILLQAGTKLLQAMTCWQAPSYFRPWHVGRHQATSGHVMLAGIKLLQAMVHVGRHQATSGHVMLAGITLLQAMSCWQASSYFRPWFMLAGTKLLQAMSCWQASSYFRPCHVGRHQATSGHGSCWQAPSYFRPWFMLAGYFRPWFMLAGTKLLQAMSCWQAPSYFRPWHVGRHQATLGHGSCWQASSYFRPCHVGRHQAPSGHGSCWQAPSYFRPWFMLAGTKLLQAMSCWQASSYFRPWFMLAGTKLLQAMSCWQTSSYFRPCHVGRHKATSGHGSCWQVPSYFRPWFMLAGTKLLQAMSCRQAPSYFRPLFMQAGTKLLQAMSCWQAPSYFRPCHVGRHQAMTWADAVTGHWCHMASQGDQEWIGANIHGWSKWLIFGKWHFQMHFYPRIIRARGYCHAPCRLSLCPSVCPLSVHLSICVKPWSCWHMADDCSLQKSIYISLWWWPSIHLSVHPALVTTLHHTMFKGSCSYLVQPLTLVGAWNLSIKEFLCSFSRIQWHFESLWILWLTGVKVLLGLGQPRVPDGDASGLYPSIVIGELTASKLYPVIVIGELNASRLYILAQ